MVRHIRLSASAYGARVVRSESYTSARRGNCTLARQGNCTSARDCDQVIALGYQKECASARKTAPQLVKGCYYARAAPHTRQLIEANCSSAGPGCYIRCSIGDVQGSYAPDCPRQLRAVRKIDWYQVCLQGCLQGIYVSGCPRGHICVAK